MPSRGERDQLVSRKRKSMASQDLGYGEFDGQDDDYGNDRRAAKDRKENRESRDSDYGVKERRAAGRRYDVQAPDTSIVLEGYRADILNGFEEPQARYNPVSCIACIFLLCGWGSRKSLKTDVRRDGTGKCGASAKFDATQYQ
ncbi:hypothetical protein EYC80_003928 [Monilinia laxa]|uniref:Uncharacterized protein n=1 Tax=Monilinia laxa TaxID=61186 RepID=A0A5N6KL73_MONLA|nr:hypothetical protein EYC80_003928 [Monilinia laxa]